MSDCVIWTKYIGTHGYGMTWRNGKVRMAHRVAYEDARGPVPDGLELDHLCRNRACVNVDHLEPVTHRENVHRGVGWGGRNARKTHCLRGHVYDAVDRPSRGGRRCRTCHREKTQAWRAANLEKARRQSRESMRRTLEKRRSATAA